MEPNTMSDRIKAYLDGPHGPNRLRPSIEKIQEVNLFKYIILGTFLVNYSCS